MTLIAQGMLLIAPLMELKFGKFKRIVPLLPILLIAPLMELKYHTTKDVYNNDILLIAPLMELK